MVCPEPLKNVTVAGVEEGGKQLAVAVGVEVEVD